MEGHCSTGQSSQWAVVPMEGEDTVGLSAGEGLVFMVLLCHCCVSIPFVVAEGEFMTYN